MKKTLLTAIALLPTFAVAASSVNQCPSDGQYLQVLGAGGPELTSSNVSTSYLLWDEGKAALLLDAGSGTAFNFKQTGAKVSDLQAILISHMHVDHISDLVSLIKASYFEQRSENLPIYGPTGNKLVPGMNDYMERLVGLEGLYPYLNNFIADAPDASYSKADYKLIPYDIEPTNGVHGFEADNVRYKTADAQHGNVPSLAWSIEYKGKTVFITGDSSGPDYLKSMAEEADLIVAHNSLPERYNGPIERLHMKPSKIADIVSDSKAHTLVLSHFLKFTTPEDEQKVTESVIKEKFAGEVSFANDFNCYAI